LGADGGAADELLRGERSGFAPGLVRDSRDATRLISSLAKMAPKGSLGKPWWQLGNAEGEENMKKRFDMVVWAGAGFGMAIGVLSAAHWA